MKPTPSLALATPSHVVNTMTSQLQASPLRLYCGHKDVEQTLMIQGGSSRNRGNTEPSATEVQVVCSICLGYFISCAAAYYDRGRVPSDRDLRKCLVICKHDGEAFE